MRLGVWINPFRWSREGRQSSGGVLICWGLLVQVFTLPFPHPIGFSVFLAVGCLLVAAGILLYLSSLLVPDVAAADEDDGSRAGS